jgi:hypothetical protein
LDAVSGPARMTRQPRPRLGIARPPRGPAFDPDLPVAGFYRVRLRRGASDSVIRIWLGPPKDPETGEEMADRGFAWQAELNGQAVDVFDYWPGCARERISREEHDRIVERNRTMNEASPFYDPKKPIDIWSAPPPF